MSAILIPMFTGQANVKTNVTSDSPPMSNERLSLDNAFLDMFASLLQETIPAQVDQSGVTVEMQVDDSQSTATVSASFDMELSDEQLVHLLAGLVQMMSESSSITGDPVLAQLAQQVDQILLQQQVREGTPIDSQARERAFTQLVELLGRLSVQEKQVITQQLLPMMQELKLDSPLQTMVQASERTVKHEPESPSEIHRQSLLLTASGKETRQVNMPHTSKIGIPLESGHRADGYPSQQQLGFQGRSHVPTSFQQATLPIRSEAAMSGGGELTEAAAFRTEATTHNSGATVSLNNTAQLSSTRPLLWMADSFSESLQQHIVRHLSVNPHGVSQARISLYPENLGQVDVRITSHNGVVTAHLVAESWVAKQLLEAQLDQLRQMMQNQGMQVSKLEVSVGQHGSLAKQFAEQHERVREHFRKQEQVNPAVNIVDAYLESETSQVESWRNPHASVSYTV